MNFDDITILFGPEYVPEGRYYVKLRNLTVDNAKNGGHPYIIPEFEITNGELAGRIIKQVWTFRRGQETRTVGRINNFLSKSGKNVSLMNDLAMILDEIKNEMANRVYYVWYSKNINNGSELLYAL